MAKVTPDLNASEYFANLAQSTEAPPAPTSGMAFTPTLGRTAEFKHAELDQKTLEKIQKIKEVAAQNRRADEFGLGDTAASFGVGAGQFVEAMGTAYGLATGDMENAARQLGQDTRQFYQDRKSGELVAEEAARSEAVKNAEPLLGSETLGQAATAFGETVSNPSLLWGTLVETAPSMVVGGAAGRVAGAATKALGASAGTAATVATGTTLSEAAVEQGASVGGETFDKLLSQPQELWDQNSDYQALRQEVGDQAAKEQIALKLSRIAGTSAGAISLLTQALPGGARLDKVLAGSNKPGTKLLVEVGKGFLGEGLQEVAEEGSGQFINNLANTVIDPNQDLSEGVGEAMGIAAAAGGAMGAAGGVANTRVADPESGNENPTVKRKREAIDAATQQAEETGDVAPLLDEQADSYDPVAAASALSRRAENQDLSEDERTAAKNQIDDIHANLAERITAGETRLEELNNMTAEAYSAERVAAVKEHGDAALADYAEQARNKVAEVQARIQEQEGRDLTAEEMAAITEPYQARAKQVRNQVETTVANIEADPEATLAAAKRNTQARIGQLQSLQTGVSTMQETSQNAARPTTDAVESTVAQVEAAETPEAQTEAVKTIQTWAMQDPGLVSEAQMDRIIANEAIPEDTRNVFKAFKAAHAAANALRTEGQVNAMIFQGGEGFKGLREYETQTNAALSKGDMARVDAELEKLDGFLDHQTNKKAAYETALAEVNESGKARYVRRQEDGSFMVTTEPFASEQERSENGGFIVAPTEKHKSAAERMINTLGLEVEAIQGTADQIRARQAMTQASVDTAQTGPATGQATATATVETPTNIPNNTPSEPASQPASAETPAASGTAANAEQASSVPPVALNDTLRSILTRRDEGTLTFAELTKAERQELKAFRALPQEEQNRLVAEHQAEKQSQPTQDTPSELNPPPIDDAELASYEQAAAEYDQVVDPAEREAFEDIPAEVVSETTTDAVVDETATTAEVEPLLNKDVVEGDKKTAEELQTLLAGNEPDPVATPTESSGQNIPNEERNGKPLVKLVHLVKHFFQRKAKKDDGRFRPLAVLNDFVGAITKDGAPNRAVLKRLSGRDLNEAAFDQIDSFMGFYNQVRPILDELMDADPAAREFEYADMDNMALYLRENGQFPENTKVAIAYGMFRFLSESGFAGTLDEERTRSMLGVADDTVLSREILDQAMLAQGTRNSVVYTLGGHIADALGYSPKANTPESRRSQLRQALGSIAINALEAQEWVTVAPVDLPDSKGQSDFIRPNLVSIAREPKTLRPIKTIARFTELYTSSRAYLDELMVGNSNLEWPTTNENEAKFDQKRIRNSNSSVSKTQAAQMQAFANQKWRVRDTASEILKLNRNILMRFAGVEPDGYQAHTLNESSYAAKILAAERQLDLLDQWIAEEGTNTFHLIPRIYATQRMGPISNTIDPQNHKIQRHFITHADWPTTFNPLTDEREIRLFRIGVAAGLGIDPGKMDEPTLMAKLDAMVSEGPVREALDILAEVTDLSEINNDPAKAEILVNAVRMGGEDMFSFDALYEYARFEKARNDAKNPKNKPTFTTDLMLEVDGVTNGPAFGHMLIGLMSPAMGRMTGFFREGDPKSIPDYKKTDDTGAKAPDLYETSAKDLALELDKLGQNAVIDAIQFFTGKLVEAGAATSSARKLLKQPITSLGFGKSLYNEMTERGVVADIGRELVDMFYTKLEDANNLPRKNGESDTDFETRKLDAVHAAIENINTLIGPDQQVDATKITRAEQGLGITLNSAQQFAVYQAYMQDMGPAIEQVLGGNFAAFIERQQQVNKMANALWERYNTAFNYFYDKVLKEENVAANKNGDALETLSEEGLKKVRTLVRDFAPFVHSASSAMDRQITAGIDIEKQWFGLAVEERKVDGKTRWAPDREFQQDVKLGKDRKSTKTVGHRTQTKEPGVRAFILLVHSLDSAVSGYSYSRNAALNLHDANATGINGIDKVATDLNRGAFRILMNYSLAGSVADRLQTSLQASERLAESDPALVKQLNKQRVKIGPKQYQPLTEFANEAYLWAKRVELTKLHQMRELTHINQYGWHSGVYTLSQQDYADIDQLIDKITQEGREFAESLDKPKKPSEQAQKPQATRPNEESYWKGHVGAWTQANQLLSELFKRTGSGKIELKKLVPALQKAIDAEIQNPEQQRFAKELLKNLSAVVDGGLSVELKDLSATNDVAQYGTIYTDDTQTTVTGEVIYLDPNKAPPSVEALLHELSHAASVHTLKMARDPELAKRLTPAQRQAAANIEALYEQAKQYVVDNNLTEHEYAISSVEEMVAFGLTNQKFQQDVLGKVEVTEISEEQLGGVKNGLWSFINNITKMLFKGKVAQYHYNGVAVMLRNAPVLFERTSRLYEAGVANQGTTVETYGMRAQDPQRMTSLEVLDALAQADLRDGNSTISQNHANYLRRVLNDVVETVYKNGFTERQEAMGYVAMTTDDQFIQSHITGEAPFTSDVATLLSANNQESYVIEALELAFHEALSSQSASSALRNEINSLYQQARTDMQGVLPDYVYDQIFNRAAQNNGRHLSRFMALALGSESVRNALGNTTIRGADPELVLENTTFRKLERFLKEVLKTISQRLAGIKRGQTVRQGTHTLAIRLASIEAKNQRLLARRLQSAENVLDRIDSTTHKAAEKLRAAVARASRSKWVGENKIRGLGLVRGVANTVASDLGGEVTDFINSHANKLLKGRENLVQSFITEVRGVNEGNHSIMKLFFWARHRDQAVLEAKQGFTSYVNGLFFQTDPKKPALSKQESAAMTQLLRTDATTLLRSEGIVGLNRLIQDRSARQAKIDGLVQQLQATVARFPADVRQAVMADYLGQAKSLAYFMVENKTGGNPNLMLNAYNIASMRGTEHQGVLTEAQIEQAEAVLDELISTYALEYLNEDTRSDLGSLIAREMDRDDGKRSAVDLLLQHYGQLQDHAKQHEFSNDRSQMIKGYTRDIYNPHTEMVTVPHDQVESYKKAGYVLESDQPLPKDPRAAQGSPQYLMVLKGRGLTDVQSGAIKVLNKAAKGSYESVTRLPAKRPLFTPGNQYDPRTNKKNSLVPVMNGAGRIIKYRYIMTSDVRDTVLERNNDVAQVLGTMVGHAVNKADSVTHNQEVIQDTYDRFRREYAQNPQNFILVSAESTDPDIRERYKLLPYETRQLIRNTTGSDGIYVRKDLYDLTFGYRKYSLAHAWQKMQQNLPLNVTERVVYHTASMVFGDSAARKIAVAENGWQELVKMVKDFWVIKSFTTLLFNEISNVSVLYAEMGIAGIPHIFKSRVEAWSNMLQFDKDRKALQELEWQVSLPDFLAGTDRDKALNQIAELKASMEQNPVKAYVDQGMMQSIVEDVSNDENPYSYASYWQEKTSSVTDRIPAMAKAPLRWMLLTHDTAGYKALHRATLMSDFAARYTLVEYLTKHSKKPVSLEEAMDRAREDFVNYDIPTHRAIQYGNDMGLIPFTKYYARIQKPIIRLLRNSPMRFVTMVLGGDLLDVPTIANSSLLEGSPVNWSWGALELPGAVFEGVPAKIAGELIP